MVKRQKKKIQSKAVVDAAIEKPVQLENPLEPAKKEEVKEEKKAETKVEEKKETAQPATKKTTAKKPATKKTETKKAETKKAETKKTQTKKAAVKKELSQHVFIQYGSSEVLANDLLEKIKQGYVDEGHRLSSIKNIDLYIKPEENMAYYVINGKVFGNIYL